MDEEGADAVDAAAEAEAEDGVRGPFLAIDPVGTRTLDDAVRATTVPGGGWSIEAAFVDLTVAIRPGSHEDTRARLREARFAANRTSRKSREANAPGLRKDALNRCLVVDMRVGEDGVVAFGQSAVRDDVAVSRLTYDAAGDMFESKKLDARHECASALRDAMLSSLRRKAAVGGDAGARSLVRRLDATRPALVAQLAVAEAMTLVNAHLSKGLADAGRGALWRTLDQDGRMVHSFEQGAHPFFDGHAHARFTSPARSYDSLVNQRCAIALLGVLPEPHDAAWMGRTATFVGDVEHAVRERDQELCRMLGSGAVQSRQEALDAIEGVRARAARDRAAVGESPKEAELLTAERGLAAFESAGGRATGRELDWTYAWCIMLDRVPRVVEDAMRERGTVGMGHRIMRSSGPGVLALRLALLDHIDAGPPGRPRPDKAGRALLSTMIMGRMADALDRIERGDDASGWTVDTRVTSLDGTGSVSATGSAPTLRHARDRSCLALVAMLGDVAWTPSAWTPSAWTPSAWTHADAAATEAEDSVPSPAPAP